MIRPREDDEAAAVGGGASTNGTLVGGNLSLKKVNDVNVRGRFFDGQSTVTGMNAVKPRRLGVLLCAVSLVVASGGVAGAVASDAPAVGDASGEPVRESEFVLAQAENESANDSLASINVPSVSVTVDGTTVSAETVLLTVRQGTGAMYVKTLTTQNPDEDASLTNARVAIGEQFWQRLQRGADGFDGAWYTVSFGRFAVGEFDFRLGTAIVRGRIGAPVSPETDALNRTVNRSHFVVTNFSAPENVTLGEDYTVTARVTNPGEQNATEIVRYVFGDVSLRRQLVELAPGASTTVSYQVSPTPLPDSPGTFNHTVEAFDSEVTRTIRLVAANGTNESAASAARPPAA